MSEAISFKLNFEPVFKDLNNMANVNQDKFQKAVLSDAQDILLNFIQKLAPRKTGKYAKSWRKGKITENTAQVITDQGDLYVLLEFTGAPPQLRTRSKGQGPYVFQAEDGSTVFTMKINWPGFDKIPHVRPAMRKLEANLNAIVAANLSILSPIFNKVSQQNKPKIEQLKSKKSG